MTEDRRVSSLAVGGLALAIFALLMSASTLVLSRIAPGPLLLLWPFLFAPLALAGGAMGFVGARRVARAPDRLQGRGIGRAAIAVAVLTLAGVIPAAVGLGVPEFRRFQMKSRKQQALHFLSRIRIGAMSFRHDSGDRRFPLVATDWVPAGSPSPRRYPYDATLWGREPWASLDFAPSAAHFHQYRYRPFDEGRGFVAQARGDLDGDGVFATLTSTVWFRTDGQVVQTGPTQNPSDEY